MMRKKIGAGLAVAAVLTVGATALNIQAASGFTVPGTTARDVHIGADDDNAANTFIQPPGVAAKQHMDNTDVLFGRGNEDLLVGKLGGDTLLGGPASDILVGGPENFTPINSDVLVGDTGDDVNIWAPGDGSDAFLGNEGTDTMIFAPFLTQPNGDLRLEWFGQRQIPRVKIDGLATQTCTIVKVPAAKNFGFDFLVRFNVNGAITVTVRQDDVEKVYCPSANAGFATFADLTAATPTFKQVKLADVPGVVGAIMAPAA